MHESSVLIVECEPLGSVVTLLDGLGVALYFECRAQNRQRTEETFFADDDVRYRSAVDFDLGVVIRVDRSARMMRRARQNLLWSEGVSVVLGL